MGKPDEIFGTGLRTIRNTFFAFNEFKKEVAFKGDPAGQVLSHVLVGQMLNTLPQPIYGCYVLGRDWYFMALHVLTTASVVVLTGTTDDIFFIFRILKALKEIVKGLTANE